MIKILILLSLVAMAGAEWGGDYIPPENISEREQEEEDSRIQEIAITNVLRNLQKLAENEERGAENNMAGSFADQVEAQQASDAISGIQEELRGDGEERREAVVGGQSVSGGSAIAKEYGFMEVPVDTQPMDETLYRY